MEKDIAIVVLNYIQYINIKPGIDKLIELGYSVDFYCNDIDWDGYRELFSDARNILRNAGYNVYENPQNVNYKVLLEPYPSFIPIKSKYKIRYRYGNISAKPNIVYLPENFLTYDCILCSGDYDANYLSVFSKVFKTGNQKYVKFRKDKIEKHSKPVLLYLPTYGKESSVELIADELNKLKKDYYIIAKIHHGTSFLKEELPRIEKIKNNVDEFYDLHTNLSDLLEIANVVLTDNSGAIFEAIYTNTPVAVFTDDINKNKLNNFNTTQYELYKAGILPYTNDKTKIKKILKEALNSKIYNKQKKWNAENLYKPKDLVKDFVNIIEMYLKDEIDKRYFEMHNILKKAYYDLKDNNTLLQQDLSNEVALKRNVELQVNNLQFEIEKLRKENLEKNNVIGNKDIEINEINSKVNKLNEKLKQTIEENNALNEKLKYYKNGKLYKIVNKIYRIKNGG